jgi:type II secretory ATPase GspE/PulE/Tfp pilus assembly ATPase PilB-like protein
MTPLVAQIGSLLTLAEAATLVSWWKPLILLVPFVPWAILVSKVFDKHCARFFLARETWNLVHMLCGWVALAAGVFMPVAGIAGIISAVLATSVILAADVFVFVHITNNDERVPANFRLKIDLSKFAEAKKAREAAKKQAKVELVLRASDKTTLAAPEAESPEFPIRAAAEALYIKGLETRSLHFDFLPTGKDNTYQMSYLVDGIRQPGVSMPATDAMKVMDLWKSAAKMDVAERRKKLQADLTVDRLDSRRKVRLISVGGQTGPRLTWIIDPEQQVHRKLDEMGLLDSQKEDIIKLTNETSGIVLLAAPGGCGRTTTFYTLIRLHDAYTQNVQTIELDIQDSLEGAKQNKWDPQAEGPDFSTLVRSIIRRDPNVVGIAELLDQNTAKEACKADLSRVRVYVSLKADDAMKAVQAWTRTVGDAAEASKNLQGVVAQKLMRKLCVNCRVEYAPSPEMVKKMGYPPDRVKQLFKKGGQVLVKNKPEECPMCQGSGYFGQEALFEVFLFTDEERAAIAAGDMNALKIALRKRNAPSIQQVAIRKAVEGITSVEEVTRVTVEAATQPKPAPAPSAPTAKGS